MGSLRFILGRAGSGKTHRCLEAVRARLREAPFGAPLVLLVPEQATFQMERALAETPGVGGFVRAHVLSFQRLARRLFDEVGGSRAPGAGEWRRRLILKTILSKERDRLGYFRLAAQRPGFARTIDETLAEWRRNGFTPDQAEALAERFANDDRRSALALKLRDLAAIERAYREAVEGKFSEPEDLLAAFPAKLALSKFFPQAEVWVDGFADFTGRERDALLALIETACATEVALCLDPETLGAQMPEADSMSPFDACERTYWRLRHAAAARGISVAPDVRLDGGAAMALGRFRLAPALGAVERGFFGRGGVGGVEGGVGGGAGGKAGIQSRSESHPPPAPPSREGGLIDSHVESRPLSTPHLSEARLDSSVRLVQRRHPADEAEFAAAEIWRLARDAGMRWSEMGVIVRELAPYEDLLRDALKRQGIPYFVDRKREFARHPLPEFLGSAARAAAHGWRREDVLQWLKTDLSPAQRDTVDRLENHALARGIEGADWLGGPKWETREEHREEAADLAELRPLRDAALAPLRRFHETLNGPVVAASRYAAALRDLMGAANVAESLETWAEDAREGGRIEEGDMHRQAMDKVDALLVEWSEGLGDMPISRADAAALLAEGFESIRLGLTPPTLEHVLIGGIERSRHPELRAVLVLGMNDGVFPKKHEEDAVLGDWERQALKDEGVELGPPPREAALREPFLAYIAFTRPCERLILSWSAADASGGPLEPSPFMERVRAALPGLTTEVESAPAMSVTEESAAGLATDWVGGASSFAALGANAARALGACARRGVAAPAPWLAIAEMAREEEGPDQDFSRRLAGLYYENRPRLEPQTAARLFGSTLETSASAVEDYAQCPFRHFAKRSLRLRPREERRLEPLDTGAVFHDALYAVFLELHQRSLAWHEAEAAELRAWLDRALEVVAAARKGGVMSSTARNKFLLTMLNGAMWRRVQTLRAESEAGQFRQTHAEARFGGPGAPFAALELELRGGARLRVMGKIDRINVLARGAPAACVIDYKTGAVRFSPTQAGGGLQLQLAIYLLALTSGANKEQFGYEPAAFFYSPLFEARAEADDKSDTPNEPDFRGVGVYGDAFATELDSGVTASESRASRFWNIKYNKDGPLSKACPAATAAEMAALLRHVEAELRRFGEAAMEGKIAPQPYRHRKSGACLHCEFTAVCRFEPELDTHRDLTPRTKLRAWFEELVAAGNVE